jgi:hypothetical protein
MAKTDLSVKIGAEFVGKAAFRAAEKSVVKLGKQVAGLALGGGLLNFAKSTVDAFYESEKSAKALNGTLSNLGLAFKKSEVKEYLNQLSLATGIVDETLNPALQVLLLNTRDLTKSQQLLGTALDISAGTGQSVVSVAEALSKAYMGNRTALGRLNLGLTKGELAAKDFNDVLRVLNYNFEGQAAMAATGFTGDVDKMRVAIDQFKEAIGAGFAKSLQDSNGNIDGTTSRFVLLGKAIGKLIELNSKVSMFQIFSKDFWRDLAGDPTMQSKMSAGFTYSLGTNASAEIAASKTRRLDAARLKIEQQQLAAQKAALKVQQDQAKIKKSQGIMDIEAANILAALQGKITENEKLRLELQLALLTGNAKEADRLSNELLLSQARTTGLATFISSLPKALNPFADYPAYVLMALAELAKLKAAQDALGKNNNQAPVKTLEQARTEAVAGVAQVTGIYESLMAKINATTKESTQVTNNTYNLNGATPDLVNQLRDGLINQSASGSQSKINRLSILD